MRKLTQFESMSCILCMPWKRHQDAEHKPNVIVGTFPEDYSEYEIEVPGRASAYVDVILEMQNMLHDVYVKQDNAKKEVVDITRMMEKIFPTKED